MFIYDPLVKIFFSTGEFRSDDLFRIELNEELVLSLKLYLNNLLAMRVYVLAEVMEPIFFRIKQKYSKEKMYRYLISYSM